MELFQNRYLLLSSLIVCFLFFSCRIVNFQSHVPTTTEKLTIQKITPVVNPFGKAFKYSASIDVLNKHFSGIVIIKKTDSITTHVVFITELGMKMFDFEKKDTAFNAVFVFEPLNKPKLVSVLKTNFKNMLLLDAFGKEVEKGLTKKNALTYELTSYKQKQYFIVSGTNNLETQAVFFKKRRSSKISYTFNLELKEYTRLQCVQYGFVKIKIELNKILE